MLHPPTTIQEATQRVKFHQQKLDSVVGTDWEYITGAGSVETFGETYRRELAEAEAVLRTLQTDQS